jgi:hypothetical protein
MPNMQIDTLRPWSPASRRILFDTADSPAEAVFYGDEMRLESRIYEGGRRFLKLEGPEGEIDLPEFIWRNILEAMTLERSEPRR